MTWKFKGAPGEFIPAVPARDLTDAEVEANYPEVAGSTLYQHVDKLAEAAAAAVEEAAEAVRKARKSNG